MASPPPADRLRRAAARPRLPRPHRGLIPRRAPLPRVPARRLVYPPVDIGGLPVRQPWWLLAARRSMLRLGRLHPAGAPSTPPTPPSVVPEPVRRAPLTQAGSRHPVVATRPLGASRRGPGIAAGPGRRTVSTHLHSRPALLAGGGSAPPAPVALGSGAAVTSTVPPEPAEVSFGRVGGLPVLGGAPVAGPSGGFDPAGSVTLPPRTPSPVTPVQVAARMHPGATPLAAPTRRTAPTTPRGPVPSLVGRHAAPAARTPLTRRVAGTDAPAPTAEARWRAAVAARPLENPRPFPTGLRPLVESLTGSAQRASYTTGPATRQALRAAGALGASTGTVVHLPAAPSPGPGSLLHVVAHELAHTRSPVSRPRFLLDVPHGSVDADERAALAVGRRIQAAGNQLTSTAAGTSIGNGLSMGNALATGGSPSIGTALSMGAGIVGDLPVGGSGRIPDIAGSARSAVEDELPDVSLPQVRMPDLPVPPDVHMPDVVAEAGATATQAASALGGAVGGAVGAAGAALGGLDIDHLAEVLEQRVLRQIERRGGRYAGMF